MKYSATIIYSQGGKQSTFPPFSLFWFSMGSLTGTLFIVGCWFLRFA